MAAAVPILQMVHGTDVNWFILGHALKAQLYSPVIGADRLWQCLQDQIFFAFCKVGVIFGRPYSNFRTEDHWPSFPEL